MNSIFSFQSTSRLYCSLNELCGFYFKDFKVKSLLLYNNISRRDQKALLYTKRTGFVGSSTVSIHLPLALPAQIFLWHSVFARCQLSPTTLPLKSSSVGPLERKESFPPVEMPLNPWSCYCSPQGLLGSPH